MNDKETPEINSDIESKYQGEFLINSLYRLIQTARMHDDNNRTVKECFNNFLSALKTCFENSDFVDIQISVGRIYLQDEVLYYRKELTGVMQEMVQFIEKRQIQGLRIYPSINEAETGHVLDFVRKLYNAVKMDSPQEYIFDQIQQPGFMWVEILHRQDTGSENVSLEKIAGSKKAAQIKKAKVSYSYALSSIKEVATKIAARKPAGIRKSIRMVQNMVELVMEDEPVLISMSTIKDYDDYTYTHSVNVAILSMCLGKYIGLPKKLLLKLGVCGLFHDLGKVNVPQEILNKPGRLDDGEMETMKQHSLDSVRHIIKMNAPRKLKSSILLPPIEHHMKFDLSGYPHVDGKQAVSLFGCILMISDCFDAITSPRKYRKQSLSPDRALKFMTDKIGKDFDPLLLKAFINMMGAYPVGTVVKLDNGAFGIVIEAPDIDESDMPKIILIEKDAILKEKYIKGDEIDLSKKNSQTGKYLNTVVESFHPSTFGIQPAVFLTSEAA